MIKTVAYIFGYGSLVNRNDWMYDYPREDAPIYGHLHNHLRHWNTAIDNSAPDKDHKHYLDATGRRFPGQIAMLALDENKGSACNGMAIPVDEKLLAMCDTREMGYIRTADVREHFSEDLDKPLLTYLSSDLSKENFRKGVRENSLAVPKYYLDLVAEAFASISKEALDDYIKNTVPPDCPELDLSLFRLNNAI